MESKIGVKKILLILLVTFSIITFFVWNSLDIRSTIEKSSSAKHSNDSIFNKTEVLKLTNQTLDQIRTEVRRRKSKTILYWNAMFSRKDWWLGSGFEPFAECAYDNCYITYEKGLQPVQKFDALIFHGVQFRKEQKPKIRLPNQVYIFGCLESPIHSHTEALVDLKNFYNWTMTYRQDSDVIYPYGSFKKEETSYEPPSVAELAKRKRTAVWMVSHCETQSKREDVVKELRKLVEIDVFGKCGDHVCPRDNANKCYDVVEENYKFYLSFENSLCKDYVTEKLYNILRRNIVPIVYGGANYSQLAPPNSVINLQDYASIQDLVAFLKYVDNNADEYLKYFEWKRHYIIQTHSNTLCSLCEKLHKPVVKKTYGDIAEWWRGKKSNQCVNPEI